MAGRGWLAVLLCADLAATQALAQDGTRRAALLAEAEAMLATAPEVSALAEWGAEIGPAAARREMAILLAEAGHFAEAEEMAALIARAVDRNRALTEIAVLVAQDGQTLRALALLDWIDDPRILSVALLRLLAPDDVDGKALIVPRRDEERSVALKAVQRAVDLSLGIDDPARRDQAAYQTAWLFLELDEIDFATAQMDRIAGDGFQVQWLDRQLRKLVRAEDFAGAEQLAEEIAEIDPTLGSAYWRLADGLAAAGQSDEAERVLGRLADPMNTVWGLTRIGVDLVGSDAEASARFLAQAEVLAMGIADPRERAAALGKVGAAHARVGDQDNAEAFADSLIDMAAPSAATARALTEIASALGEAGKGNAAAQLLDKAEERAMLIDGVESRSSALSLIAWSHSFLGRYADAERIALGIEDEIDRGGALEDLGVTLAETGQVAEAQRIAAVLRGPAGSDFHQGSGPQKIASALAAAGEVAAAEAVAAAIADPSWRANAMSGVALALAEGENLSEAERIARRIEDPAWRAVALGAVAAGL